MANDITGSCEIGESVELIPDAVDDILPPGYLSEGTLPIDTTEKDIGIDPAGGVAITGECAECPEGYVWGCCEDTNVEYPPGYPAFSSCIALESNGYRQGKNFFKQIDNRIWADNQGESVVIYDITDTGLVYYKTIGTPVAAFPEIIYPAHVNHRFTAIATIGPDRVILMGDDGWGAGGTPEAKRVMWVYNRDGVFQDEYFITPPAHGMRYGISTKGSLHEVPGTDFFAFSYPYALNGSYSEVGIIAWYDYYGTMVNLIETASRIPLQYMRISGNYMWLGYDYPSGVDIRNASTGALIRSVANPTGEVDARDWGGNGVDVLSSNGLEDIIVVMHRQNVSYTDTETTNRKFFYRPNGDLLFEIPHSTLLDGYHDKGIHFQFASWRYGNVIYNGSPDAGANSSSELYSTGIMLAYDATTGEIVSQPSSPIPLQGINSQLGYAVFANRDAITMFMSPVAHTGYMKICKMSFYE